MAKSKPQYYGPYEIESMTEQADGTLLTFKPKKVENGNEYTPPEMFVPSALTDVITDEPTDYNTWYDARLNPAIAEIIQVFIKYNVFIGAGEGVASDMSYIFDRVVDYVRNGRRQVEERQWGAPEHAKTMRQLMEHLKN